MAASNPNTSITFPQTNSLQGFYTPTHISTNTTTSLKASAALLHTITVNKAGTSTTATVYDSSDNSGTVLAVIDTTVKGSLTYDFETTAGLCVVTAGTTAGDITISSL